MNILFVNNAYNLFAKADCGASQRSMSFLHALRLAGHVDVVSFVDETVSTVSDVEVVYSKYIANAVVSNSKVAKIRKLLPVFSLSTIYPLQPEKEKILDEIISQNKYDVIVVRYIRFACDCGLLKYASKLYVDIDDGPKFGILNFISKGDSFGRQLYYKLYANAVDKACRKLVKRIKGAFYSTPNLNYQNACFLPNISVFQHSLHAPKFDKVSPAILMVGSFNYYPNVEGLHHFIKYIFPKIRRDVLDASLFVIGKMGDGNLRMLCLNTDGVVSLGFVENLEEQYAKAHCVIIPIYKGTGTSVKLIEAMSLGRAVVTTPCGARGLNPAFVANEDYFLAENDDDFARKVCYLLTHPAENNHMLQNATQKIDKYYSQERFNSIIMSAVNCI